MSPASGPRVHFHVPGHQAGSEAGALPRFYHKLIAEFGAIGIQSTVVPRNIEHLEQGDLAAGFHFVHNGRINRPRVLNLGLAYVSPFWYMDPLGIYADSSLTDAVFPMGQAHASNLFTDRLVKRLVDTRTSRYTQPDSHESFPKGAIAVFLQGRSDPVLRVRHMDSRAMLQAVLADTGGRPVVVKPHPRNLDDETTEVLRWLRRDHPVVIHSRTNVHDILADASLCVTISSAVAIEAMLHRVPSVLFGRTDFHHCAETVRDCADWPGARDRALTHTYRFAAFLQWFLGKGMINAGRADMMEEVLRRMVARGFDRG